MSVDRHIRIDRKIPSVPTRSTSPVLNVDLGGISLATPQASHCVGLASATLKIGSLRNPDPVRSNPGVCDLRPEDDMAP